MRQRTFFLVLTMIAATAPASALAGERAKEAAHGARLLTQLRERLDAMSLAHAEDDSSAHVQTLVTGILAGGKLKASGHVVKPDEESVNLAWKSPSGLVRLHIHSQRNDHGSDDFSFHEHAPGGHRRAIYTDHRSRFPRAIVVLERPGQPTTTTTYQDTGHEIERVSAVKFPKRAAGGKAAPARAGRTGR